MKNSPRRLDKVSKHNTTLVFITYCCSIYLVHELKLGSKVKKLRRGESSDQVMVNVNYKEAA